MKVYMYIEKNNLQLDVVKNVDFIHVYFCKAKDTMQYIPPNTYQEVLNTNHSGSISDSLGRLAAESQCMASLINILKQLLRFTLVDIMPSVYNEATRLLSFDLKPYWRHKAELVAKQLGNIIAMGVPLQTITQT